MDKDKGWAMMLEEALENMLSIIDGKEFKSAESIAMVHGFSVSEEVSSRNQKMVEDAYKLLGKYRSNRSF
jgi:hypothetical protein